MDNIARRGTAAVTVLVAFGDALGAFGYSPNKIKYLMAENSLTGGRAIAQRGAMRLSGCLCISQGVAAKKARAAPAEFSG